MKKLMLMLGMGVMLSAAPGTDEFKTLIDGYWAAWSTLDPAKAAPMYDQSASAVFFRYRPLEVQRLEGISGSREASFRQCDECDVRRQRRSQIHAPGQPRLDQRHLSWHGQQKDGTTMNLVGRHTAIWEKRGAKWIIVHEHVSAPLP